MRFALAAGGKVAALYPTKDSARAVFLTIEDARDLLRQLEHGIAYANTRDGRHVSFAVEWDESAIALTVPLLDAMTLRDQLVNDLPKPRKQRASKIERAAEKARPFIRSLRPGAPDVGDDVPLPIRLTPAAEERERWKKIGGAR